MNTAERRETLTKQYRELQSQVAQGQAALLRIEGALALLNELDSATLAAPPEVSNGDRSS